MKRLIVILVPVFVVTAAFLLVVLYSVSSTGNESAQPAGKLMSIESYVTQHISDLSPVVPSLGGTFYVTDVRVAGGEGTVQYEDGHDAHTARFTYEATDRTGIQITSFTLVQ